MIEEIIRQLIDKELEKRHRLQIEILNLIQSMRAIFNHEADDELDNLRAEFNYCMLHHDTYDEEIDR